jgi:hypothetical protein
MSMNLEDGVEVKVEVPEAPPEDVVDLENLQRGHFLDKIRFIWRTEDQSFLDRIEAVADEQFAKLFSEAISSVDRFYEALYTPRYRNASPVVDRFGRQMWETGNDGKPIENWDQLTGQDIEQVLMNLQRIKMTNAPAINKLKNEAIFAKMRADDIKDDTWQSVMQGTQGDRTARANTRSREDRYHAYFRYYLWSVADIFNRELVDFVFRLKDVRYWKIQAQE